MGCTSSSVVPEDPNLIDDINDFNSGQIPKNSVRYRMFISDAAHLLNEDQFYMELSNDKLIEYFKRIGLFSQKEAQLITQKLILTSSSSEEAQEKLRTFLPLLRIQVKNKNGDKPFLYLSPGVDPSLYRSIVKSRYNTAYGIFETRDIIDFSSSEVAEMREKQLNDQETSFPHINHSKEMSILINSNPLEEIWKRNLDEKKLSKVYFQKLPSKPFGWIPNIHEAARKGKSSSVFYNISLIPSL